MANDGDLRRQLGALMRSALQQLDAVREVVVQRTKVGRIQLDVAMLRRKRRDALAELGEVVARLAAAGRLGEDEHPELGGPLSALEAIDEHIAAEEERARRVAEGHAGDGHAPARDGDHDEDADDEARGPKDILDRDTPTG
jgi:hypothetical protein